MMIFGNICQIVRKRCQMIKQMRKKANLEEKYLVLGGLNYEETGRTGRTQPVIVLDIFLQSSASREHYEH